MATTQSYAHAPAPVSGGSAMNIDQGQRYISSRRSSSSSSSSHSRPFISKPQAQMPSSYRDRNGYFAAASADRQELLRSYSELNGEGDEQDQDQDMGMNDQSNFTPLAMVSKGKQRATTYHERPVAMFQIGEGRREEYKSDWMIDEAGSSAGADAWVERDRVILVLGRPTPDSLSPLLYNPQYASTLLLIALSQPSSAFAQLAAQTPAERTTYPIIQLLDMSKTTKDNPSHPLPSILEQASRISYQWRAALRSPPPSRMSFIGSSSRRASTDSMASSLPPLTPPLNSRSRMSAPQIYSRRSSETSNESQNDPYTKRFSANPSSRDSRPPVSNRKSSFFGLGKSASDSKTSPPASPFDAVVHVIPPASDFPPNRALQEMLQSAVLLTSTVVPMLAKRNLSSSKNDQLDTAPISLVHIIQPNSPQALPPVIENFVLSLVPKFQGMSERKLSPYVVSQSAWLHPAEQGFMSGGDLLLFGGAQVRPTTLPDGSVRIKKRAYIPYWPHQGPPMTVAPNPDFTRADYSTMVPLAPPASEKPASPRRKSTTPRSSPASSRPGTKLHRSGLSQVIMPSDLEDVQSLHTPELDAAPSSASSQSHEAATPRASTYGSEMSSPTLTVDDTRGTLAAPASNGKDSKDVKKHGGGGFGSFVKRFGKKH